MEATGNTNGNKAPVIIQKGFYQHAISSELLVLGCLGAYTNPIHASVHIHRITLLGSSKGGQPFHHSIAQLTVHTHTHTHTCTHTHTHTCTHSHMRAHTHIGVCKS